MYNDFTKRFMKHAGEVFKKYYYGNKNTQFKSDTTPVTLADLEINSLLIQMAQESFPDHAIIGEEESSNKKSIYTWVCDPVDGTIPYSHSMPISTICLSLLENGKSIFGAIYNPITEQLFIGDGNFSYCNDTLIKASQENDIKKGLVAIECFPRAAYDFKALYGALTDLDIKVIQLCSIAYPSSLIASGELMATIHPANHIREFAAIKPIIEGAGGKVTDLLGNEQNYLGQIHGHLATNGIMHDFFVSLIKKYVII